MASFSRKIPRWMMATASDVFMTPPLGNIGRLRSRENGYPHDTSDPRGSPCVARRGGSVHPPASEIRKQPGRLRLPVALVPGNVVLPLEGQGDLVEPFEEALLGERPDFEPVHRSVRAGHRLGGEVHRDLAPGRALDPGDQI